MPRTQLRRRDLVLGLAALAGAFPLASHAAEDLPSIKVSRDPSCGCCGAWADHLRQAGFAVDVVETSQLNRIKARLGVPQELASCHTAEVAGYVVEGHVPAPAIKRLIRDKPQATGLAVPGMPVGSPGMDVEGANPDTYDVVLFGPSGKRSFARYRGAAEI